MKSLLLKDLLNLRGYVKIITFFVVFYGLITFTMDDLNFLSGMVIILFMMIPISSFNYDQHSKWDVFSQALPVSRKEIVQSKYVLGCLFLIIGFTVSFLMSAIVSIIKYSSVEWKDMFVTNAMIVVVSVGKFASAGLKPFARLQDRIPGPVGILGKNGRWNNQQCGKQDI